MFIRMKILNSLGWKFYVHWDENFKFIWMRVLSLLEWYLSLLGWKFYVYYDDSFKFIRMKVLSLLGWYLR